MVLVEKWGRLASMWKWLVGASREEVLGLPLVGQIPREGLDVLDLRPEARTLIGLNLGFSTHTRNTPGPMALAHQDDGSVQWWNAAKREALARAVSGMRSWEVVEGDYSAAPDIEATWFVDPPYERKADMYAARVGDYGRLGDWCRGRRGQVVVCEDAGASWLPFVPLDMSRRSNLRSGVTARVMGARNQHREGVWIRD